MQHAITIRICSTLPAAADVPLAAVAWQDSPQEERTEMPVPWRNVGSMFVCIETCMYVYACMYARTYKPISVLFEVHIHRLKFEQVPM